VVHSETTTAAARDERLDRETSRQAAG